MNLKEWARLQGIHPVSAYRWCRDRFARFGAGYVEAALSAQGRQLRVVDPVEVDDDLGRDVTEILTSLCARLYGRRAAKNRAARLTATVAGIGCAS